MDFPAQRIDDGYFKVLVVGEAIVAEVLRQRVAVLDCFQVGVEFNSNPIPQGNAVFHIEEKSLHCKHLALFGRSPASTAEIIGARRLPERLAETPRLGLNDGY
jgi:hypothetical protein